MAPKTSSTAARRAAPPVFTGITPAALRHWTLVVPLTLALITSLGMVFPDARDSLVDTVLGIFTGGTDDTVTAGR